MSEVLCVQNIRHGIRLSIKTMFIKSLLVGILIGVGWFGNILYSKLMTIRSYNHILANQYSDYLLPLTHDFRESINNEKDLREFKNLHQDLRWLSLNPPESRIKIAFVYSDHSPYHVAFISNAMKESDSVKIMTVKEFMDYLAE